MANRLVNFVRGDEEGDLQGMPPPPININRSVITAGGGQNNSRAKLFGSQPQKFNRGRSIPLPAAGTPKQSPYAGARKVVDKLGELSGNGRAGSPAQQEENGDRDPFDTDLASETGTDDTLNTLNAVDQNRTRKVEREEEEGADVYGDEAPQNGYMGEDGQYYRNGGMTEEQQFHGDGQQSDESDEGEDDEEMPKQHGQGINGARDGHYYQPQQQARQSTQPLQHPAIMDFDDIPVRGGSPNSFPSRMADARNIQAPARRYQGQSVQQVQQYDGPDNFAATSVGDDESETDENEYENDAEPHQNGYVQPQNQPQYQNQIHVHQQQQQQQMMQPKPRTANQIIGQEKPVYQRIQGYKSTTAAAAFAPSELDETTTFDEPEPVPPPKKAKEKEKRKASPPPPARKRAASPELDFDKKTLFEMKYSDLANQPFETKPPSQRPPTVIVKGKTVTEKLEKGMQLEIEPRAEFLANLTIREWEEAGEWFVGRFGDVMKRFVELRRERREMAEGFEKRLGERDANVDRCVEGLKREMADMRKGGEGILRGKSPGGF